MIKCIELNREFSTKAELYAALKQNEKKIISLKRAAIQKSAEKGQFSPFGSAYKIDSAAKSELGFKDGYFYPVINTTKYIDSHRDVHFDGIWTKTVGEQQGKIYYVDNHSFRVKDVIAWPEDVEVMVKSIPWTMLGKSYPGNTEALIYGIPEDKIRNADAAEVVRSKRNVQNSVSMIYVKVALGINDSGADFKENKAYFDKRYSEIANKEVVDELGYFWGVEEAKIYKEGSMVLAGSNDATPIFYDDNGAGPGTTPKNAQDEEAANKALQEKQFFTNLI